MPTITPLPTPPQTSDGSAVFASRGDALLSALPNFVTEMNAFAASVTPIGRNMLINGDMRIDQRNSGAAVTPTTVAYTLDRWLINTNVASKITVQQLTANPPQGFAYYANLLSTSAYAVAAGEYVIWEQPIEGFNAIRMNYGTANAAPGTLSFFVKSSLTGTFGGALRNNGNTRSYPFTYTISVANTWEYKQITIPGDTTGTWLTTLGQGISLSLGLGAGTTLSGTAGAWAAANYVSATGAKSVVATNAATFLITGVQFEAGSAATPFEYKSYAHALSDCQRYYKILEFATSSVIAVGQAVSASAAFANLLFGSPMRATPTVTLPAAGGGSGQINFATSAGGVPATIGSNVAAAASKDSMRIDGSAYTAMFTAGNASMLQVGSGVTVLIKLDVEL